MRTSRLLMVLSGSALVLSGIIFAVLGYLEKDGRDLFVGYMFTIPGVIIIVYATFPFYLNIGKEAQGGSLSLTRKLSLVTWFLLFISGALNVYSSFLGDDFLHFMAGCLYFILSYLIISAYDFV